MKWATENIQIVNFIIQKSKKGWHFDKAKLKQAEIHRIRIWKVSFGCIDFRNEKCHIINYLLTSTDRPCCIDLAIARSVQEGLGLIFYRKERTVEVNK